MKLPNQANIEHKLRIYFYTSALKQRYTEGTDNKIKEDYNNLIKWIGTEIVPTEIEDGVQWNSSKMIRLNKGGAIGKAVLCAINYNQPKDFYTDTQTGVGRKVKYHSYTMFFHKSNMRKNIMNR